MTTTNNFPTREYAEFLLAQAEQLNPGPWGKHSRNAAECARKIAIACGYLDAEKAYILGLLHDIGRRFGISHLAHVYDGYKYMLSLGYHDVAKICLTHSFCTHDINAYIGKFDISQEKQEELRCALDLIVYDDYDKLIQLCDALAGANGVLNIEERMMDVKQRYGFYPQTKWDKNLELKSYFEAKANADIYSIVRQ